MAAVYVLAKRCKSKEESSSVGEAGQPVTFEDGLRNSTCSFR